MDLLNYSSFAPLNRGLRVNIYLQSLLLYSSKGLLIMIYVLNFALKSECVNENETHTLIN